jgi:hypothetical protein
MLVCMVQDDHVRTSGSVHTRQVRIRMAKNGFRSYLVMIYLTVSKYTKEQTH